MKSIKEIIGNLRVAMTDARQNESHFESWKILNEAICNAIDVLAEQPIQQGITLDGMTANEFALAELYAFQEATGCDTADQLQEQPKREQKLEFVLPGGGYVPAIPRTLPLDWKLVPRKATPEMLRAMDECAQEGYDERLYEGMASSVYMAAWDASPVLGTLPPSEKERSMMDIIVGNLVREGINKHRARELAEHFIKHTSPPKSKPWVGLTQQDINIAFDDTQEGGGFDDFARAIEAKLREKNGWYRQHVTDGSPCWCEPEISYTNPETGASVIVHKEPQ